jgi:DNA-binding NtrC family response regulator
VELLQQITLACRAAVDALVQHNWTGNIRELRNVVERLVILSDKIITVNDVYNFVFPTNA